MTLSDNFVIELYKMCLNSERVLDAVVRHVEYYFFNVEVQKKCFKFLLDYKKTNDKTPTIGTISQGLPQNSEVLEFLSRVKDVETKNLTDDSILTQLEDFVRKSRFVALHGEVADIYSKGETDKAIEMLAKKSEQINNFSIKDNYYSSIFSGYQERYEARKRKNTDISQIVSDKISSGIPDMDTYLKGGFRRKTSTLIMATSGGGKSTWLRWIGAYNAQLGKNVVHFQAEGSKDECETGYDACWTGVNIDDMEIGNIAPESILKIEKAAKNIMALGGEIRVHATETFDSMWLEDCRDVLFDIQKLFGPIDVILWDYLELFKRKGSFENERHRREAVANGITDISIEFNASCIAATQAMNIPKEKLNNPEFVMTRDEISEFKGMVKPFSYFLTVNATNDERDLGICRVHGDKFRKHSPNKTWRFYQALDKGRFIDIKRSREISKKQNDTK